LLHAEEISISSIITPIKIMQCIFFTDRSICENISTLFGAKQPSGFTRQHSSPENARLYPKITTAITNAQN
jgi:hypothetical protein